MTLDVIINYAAPTDFRQRYYANDHSKDTVVIDGRSILVLSICRARHARLSWPKRRLVCRWTRRAWRYCPTIEK
jgi:hypothetical protein